MKLKAIEETEVQRDTLSISLDELLPVRRRPDVARHGVLIGKLAGFTSEDEPLVSLKDSEGLRAQSTIKLGKEQIGRRVVLVFDAGDPDRPIVIGLLQEPRKRHMNVNGQGSQTLERVQIDADNERLVLTAEKEIVLQCGKASITLTRAGKVLIRGAYVVSQSTGANCVKGGSVHIN